jgi:hypothetical protein
MIGLTIALGVVSIIAGSLASGIVCLFLATVLSIGALALPAWRDRVEERR